MGTFTWNKDTGVRLSRGLTKPHSAAHGGPSQALRSSSCCLPSTEHPGWPRKPTLEQAKEVRSQPLTAIRKSGEACQPLPVLGPLQSSCFMVRLEFQAGMFSRQQWGKCKFQRLSNILERNFLPVSLQATTRPSWEWEVLLGLGRSPGWPGKRLLPGSRGNGRCI